MVCFNMASTMFCTVSKHANTLSMSAHPSPLQVLSEALNWLSQAVEEFGLAALDVRSLLAWAKEDLGSANAGVRNSAIHLLGVMHK